jgi:hypothetical protein
MMGTPVKLIELIERFQALVSIEGMEGGSYPPFEAIVRDLSYHEDQIHLQIRIENSTKRPDLCFGPAVRVGKKKVMDTTFGIVEIKTGRFLREEGSPIDQVLEYIVEAPDANLAVEADAYIVKLFWLKKGTQTVHSWEDLKLDITPLREAVQEVTNVSFQKFLNGEPIPIQDPCKHPDKLTLDLEEAKQLVFQGLLPRLSTVGPIDLEATLSGVFEPPLKCVLFKEFCNDTGSNDPKLFVEHLATHFVGMLLVLRFCQSLGLYRNRCSNIVLWALENNQSFAETLAYVFDAPVIRGSEAVQLVLHETTDDDLKRVLYKLARWDLKHLGRDFQSIYKVIDEERCVPDTVAKMVVRSGLDSHSKLVYDPCCGGGLVLAEVLRHLIKIHQRVGKLMPKDLSLICSRISGSDIFPLGLVLARIAIIQVILDETRLSIREAYEMAWKVTLDFVRANIKKYDLIITQTRFRRIHKRREPLSYGSTGMRNDASAIFNLAMNSVKFKGTVVVSVDKRVLYSKGNRPVLSKLKISDGWENGKGNAIVVFRPARPVKEGYWASRVSRNRVTPSMDPNQKGMLERLSDKLTPFPRYYEVKPGLELGNIKRMLGDQFNSELHDQPIIIKVSRTVHPCYVSDGHSYLVERHTPFKWVKSEGTYEGFRDGGPKRFSALMARRHRSLQHAFVSCTSAVNLSMAPYPGSESPLFFNNSTRIFLAKPDAIEYPLDIEWLSRIPQLFARTYAICNLPTYMRKKSSWDVGLIKEDLKFGNVALDVLLQYGERLKEVLVSTIRWEELLDPFLQVPLKEYASDISRAKEGRILIGKNQFETEDPNLALFLVRYQELNRLDLDTLVPRKERFAEACDIIDFRSLLDRAKKLLLNHDYAIGTWLGFNENEVRAYLNLWGSRHYEDAVDQVFQGMPFRRIPLSPKRRVGPFELMALRCHQPPSHYSPETS